MRHLPCAILLSLVLLSCSDSLTPQEHSVDTFLKAVQKSDLTLASKYLPQLATLAPEQQQIFVKNLASLGTYTLVSQEIKPETTDVKVQFKDVTITFPVKKINENYILLENIQISQKLGK